jgi:CheY-like chemotaxis protein
MAPARILIVEDELIITLDLEDWLQHLGHHVLALATSGEEGPNPTLLL